MPNHILRDSVWILITTFSVTPLGCHPTTHGSSAGLCDVPVVLSHLQDRTFRDDTGEISTKSSLGAIDLTNEFFQNLGTNGRRCVTCHVPSRGWTITPGYLMDVFDRTGPPSAPVSLLTAQKFRRWWPRRLHHRRGGPRTRRP